MRPDQKPEIPTVKDIQYLVESVDSLVERRPMHGEQLPVLLFKEGKGGTTAAQFIAGYHGRLRDAHQHWLVPHAFITSKDLEDQAQNDLLLLDRLTDSLQDFMPRSMGKLHLPTYCAIRAVLHMQLDEKADYDEQTASVRHMLYKKYVQKRQWLHWTQSGLSDITIDHTPKAFATFGFTIALKCISTPLVWLLYGRKLQIGRKYQWFTNQIAELGLGSHNFLRASVHLSHISKSADSSAPVQRILISALLQDLQDAAKPSFWSIRRNRRTTPFILLFEKIAAHDAVARRFIEAFVAIRPDFPGSNILLLAAIAGDLPNIPDIEKYRSLDGAVHDMAHADFKTKPQVLSIQFPPDSEQQDSAAKWWLFSHRAVVRKKRLADFRQPLLSLCLVLLLLTAGGYGVWRVYNPAAQKDVAQACSYTQKTYTDKNGVSTSERVGIIGDKPNLDCSFSEPLQNVEQQILKQNSEVKGKGFVTIVYAAPLDVPRDQEGRPKDGRQNQSGLWHLQGVAKAQQNINEEAAGREGEGKLRVKILLANTGDQLKHGNEVAKQIGNFVRDPANEDWRVIGVAGINQSRKEARDIIQTFNTDYSLPVIGSSPTGDVMKDAGSASYMVAAPNSRQAYIAANFAQTEPIVGTPTQLQKTRNAVIVMDDDDEYAYNLADDFRKEFATNGHHVSAVYNLPADGIDDPKLPDTELLSPAMQTVQERAKPEEIAQQICNGAKGFDAEQDIIFYASRSQEFDDVLYALQHSNCDSRLTILGGSDLGQFRDYKKYPIIQDHFYYMAFASAGNPDNNELTAGPILSAYKESSAPGTFLNESDFARAYDSIYAFGLSANALSSDDNPVTNETVKTFLSGSTPLEFAGVSGFIKLAGSERLRVPPQKPVLVMKPTNFGTSVKMSCGWFGSANDRSYGATHWGYEDGDQDEFSCP